jgi:hypothetical protein
MKLKNNNNLKLFSIFFIKETDDNNVLKWFLMFEGIFYVLVYAK